RSVPRPRPFAIELSSVACTVVLLAVAFCVVYPLLLVVLESFQVAPPGQPARYGLDGWRAAFAEPLLRAALLNTLKVTVARLVLGHRVDPRHHRIADGQGDLADPGLAQHERGLRGGFARRGRRHRADRALDHDPGHGAGRTVGAPARHDGVAADLRGGAGAGS